VRGLPKYDGRAAFSTWSYRVATNACLDELRRRARRPDPGLPDLEVAPAGGPPELDEQVSDRLDIDDALLQLPEEFRAPLVLRDLGGLDYAAIAEVLDVPLGTVRSRLARGRSQLARLLEGNQDAAAQRTSDGS
jgi:RNA polymerase sigma-70 factor (ECF subfamily)